MNGEKWLGILFVLMHIKETLLRFFVNWWLTPLKKKISTIRHANQEAQTRIRRSIEGLQATHD